jgi:hypothetical protein
MGAGEMKMLADCVHQKSIGGSVDRGWSAVDRESYLHLAVSVEGDGWFSEWHLGRRPPALS